MAILNVGRMEFELTEDRALTLERDLAAIEPGGVVVLDLDSASGRRKSLRIPQGAVTLITFGVTWEQIDAEEDAALATRFPEAADDPRHE